VLGWLLLSCTVQADAQVTVKFNLPSQTLAESLRAVASQTQTNILFDRVLVHGLMAQALDAQLNLDQAMRRLLAGTGLTYRKTDEKTVVIVVADKTGDPSTTHDTASPGRPAPTQRLASTAGLTANGIDAQSSMAKDSDATRLEETTVTARRREESLYAVPVAVTALSPGDIRARGIQTAEDLQNYVPSLNVSSSVTRDDYTFSLRGMGPTGGSGPVPFWPAAAPAS
jgi:iron complex outermembrane receptor protein